jgi:hypothetical protein
MALRFLETDTAESTDRTLERTRVPGIWKLPLSTGLASALYRTETVQQVTRDFFKEQNLLSNISFIVLPPGATSNADAIAAGPELPGWSLSYLLLDPRLTENTARARITSYLWIGYLNDRVSYCHGCACGAVAQAGGEAGATKNRSGRFCLA